ncbi:hypothetical protein YC2023_012151 [Brassica napus]
MSLSVSVYLQQNTELVLGMCFSGTHQSHVVRVSEANWTQVGFNKELHNIDDLGWQFNLVGCDEDKGLLTRRVLQSRIVICSDSFAAGNSQSDGDEATAGLVIKPLLL